MHTKIVLIICASLWLLLPATVFAQGSIPPANPPYYPPAAADEGPAHPDIPHHKKLVEDYNAGVLTLDDMRRMGLSVFATPFNSYDGLGDGAFVLEEWLKSPLELGHRPTLQGNGMFGRLHGLDSRSCNECHNIVSNRTRLPSLGLGGVGDISQNAMPAPTLIDVGDSSEERVKFAPHVNLDFEADGVADYNGRFINPPFLYGGGGVELLGKEMTDDLQRRLKEAMDSDPGTIVYLDTHGVNFGYLIVDNDGKVNFEHIEGINDDLVVRPFNRKGGRFSMRDFDRDAMAFHFGIQPVESVGEDVDEDLDGYVNEITIGEMTVLHFFDVCNPRPVIQLGKNSTEQAELDQAELLMEQGGCFRCHKPILSTYSTQLPLAFPEIPEAPYKYVYAEINLVDVGFTPNFFGGVFVPLFADLKRHDMGDELAETLDGEDGKPDKLNRQFTTARLWGVADTAPYLHDGRATTLYQAIYFHGGEAEPEKVWFMEHLTVWQQKLILKFLMHLRTPENPNEDLLPLTI
jgi:cytochrome c peroxidase